MATSTITNVAKDPSGVAVAGITVIATLRPGPGFRVDDGSEVTAIKTTTSAGDGSWSLALERNANITPAGSWWEIEEVFADTAGGPRQWTIGVGAVNATLLASLIGPPPTSGPAYLTQGTADARYAGVAAVAAGPTVGLGVADRLDWYLYGHSYTAGGYQGASQANASLFWTARVTESTRALSMTNRGVGSTLMVDFAGRAFGGAPWVCGTRGILCVNGTLNDVNNGGGTAKGQAGFRNALTAMLELFAAGARIEHTNGQFVYTGTWTTFTDARCSGGTAKQTTVQGSYADVAFTGDSMVLIVHGIDGAGGTVQVANGATVLATVDLSNQMLTSPSGLNWCHYAIPVSGFGAGSHTVRVSKTDASSAPVRLDVMLLPHPSPPAVILVGNGPIPDPSYAGDTVLATINGLLVSVAAGFANAVVVDARDFGWSAATSCGVDRIHPNDHGNSVLATAVQAAANQIDWTNGTHILGTLSLPSGTLGTPNSSGFAGTPANGAVSGGVSTVASPWSGFTSALSFDGSGSIDFGATATGLSAAFCVEFKWQPTAASMGTNEELISRYSSDVVAGAGNCRIYNVPTGGLARLVAQWRDAGGTIRQIVGPGNIGSGTLRDVSLTWDGTTMRLFRDGVLVGSLASSVETPDATTSFVVGDAPGPSVGKAQSVIEEVRLSNVARYTAGYTPPVAPFTTDANTVLLVHGDTIS
ncbi:MAG TPA: LamG-like jellyroll fold domain-containing protein [Acidimicrobiales bacterium]|nr:LamG-like jellyroll fold domain-containing protein [Acidimicrobiales bacterium]